MIPEILDMTHEKASRNLQTYISSVREGNPLREEFEGARRLLLNHIYWEETRLFRVVENTRNSARIHGMEVEHGGIWKLLDKIGDYVKAGEDELAIDRLEGLLRVLETHHQAEARTIYRDLNSMDYSTQAELVFYEIEQAAIPQGWVCSILRGRK